MKEKTEQRAKKKEISLHTALRYHVIIKIYCFFFEACSSFIICFNSASTSL